MKARPVALAALFGIGLGVALAEEGAPEGDPAGDGLGQLALPMPVTDAAYRPVDPGLARVGQLLFYDPVLSGNRNIACATCHHPRYGTSDGLSLGMGEGGIGLGPARRADPANPPQRRIARNAPALWNLGAHEVTALFADGRIEADASRPSGLRTPLEDELLEGYDGILAVQSLFPVLAPDEMAGHPGENDIADAVAQGRLTGDGGALDLIAARVAALPEYAALFAEAVPAIAAGRPIGFADIANALAAFIAFEFRSDSSAWDHAVWGAAPLPPEARAGKALFFGRAGCGACHAGPFFTDRAYHAMGQPQLGPGTAGPDGPAGRDAGRMRVTGRAEDAYAFRTPSLRNVAATGPWGHAGAFADLRAFLRHHADPVAGLAAYTPQAVLPPMPGDPPDWAAMDDPAERAAIAAAVRLNPPELSEADLDLLLAFLEALTDAEALAGRLGIPETVPSALPVPR